MPASQEEQLPTRRYDVDWLRSAALLLLIVYHVAITFQPWAAQVGFPANTESLSAIWPVMSLFNIWRIPLLFLVSGMGVAFAMRRRTWWQLLIERTVRLVPPYVVGIFGLGSLFAVVLPALGWRAEYGIHFGHLWFLANIYFYVLWSIGFLMWLQDSPRNWLSRFVSRLMRWPGGLVVALAGPMVLEAVLVGPNVYAVYVDTLHGWLVGYVCFFMGFVFVFIGEDFWPATLRNRWPALILAGGLYALRVDVFGLDATPNALIAVESACWIVAALGFAARWLNRNSWLLRHASRAVFPVYIVHMPVQFVLAYLLIPLAWGLTLKFIVLLAGTFGLSLAIYMSLPRRPRWLLPVFGLKPASPQPATERKDAETPAPPNPSVAADVPGRPLAASDRA